MLSEIIKYHFLYIAKLWHNKLPHMLVHSTVLLCPPSKKREYIVLHMSVRMSVCSYVRPPDGFRMITQERIGLGSWNFIGTLIMTGRWPILIFRSLGQRSRSQWQQKYSHNCCHYNWQPIWGACMFYKQPLLKDG